MALAFKNNKTGAGAIYTANIDHIRITVTYAPAVAQTAYAALYTTGGTLVTGSEVSLSGGTWTRVRTGSPISLSDGTDYVVRIKVSSGGTAYIANAKIIFDQTAAGGIDKLETAHQQVNTKATGNSSTYALQDFDNEYNPSNWAGGTFNYYFEASLRVDSQPGGTAYAQLYNVSGSDPIDDPTNSEIYTVAGNTYNRLISADLSGNTDWPSTAKTLDTQIKCASTPCNDIPPPNLYAFISSSRLIIKVSGLAPAGGGGGTATLTQRAYVFQNDSGNIPDTNTNRGTGIAYPVLKGERFTVRFQIDNTGDAATTTQLHVQYDHNDGVWKSVTSGEIALSPGISGSNGDALTATTSQCVAGTSFMNGKWHEDTATSLGFMLDINQVISKCTFQRVRVSHIGCRV